MATLRLCILCALSTPSFSARTKGYLNAARKSGALMELNSMANLTAFLDLALEMQWNRSQIVSELCGRYWIGDLKVECYNREKEGLIWSGSSWYPGKVFKDGFQKTPWRPDQDPGESVDGWGEAILNSVTKNQWAYGFHFTVNPRVAGTFGAQHVGRSRSAERQGEDKCDFYDAECNRGVLRQFQEKYGCPANGAPVFEEDPNCWEKPCIRLDKLSDEELGLESLCPNWGYAYLIKAEGIHVRVQTHAAFGKDYSAEEEVFVPVGVEGNEVLGAIPIYARKADGSKRTPAIINFAQNWAFFKKLKVNGLHTQDGKGATSGIGSFIHNPNYAGKDGPAEVAEELKRKGISNDLGVARPKYQ